MPRKVILHVEDSAQDVFLVQRAIQKSKLPELPELRVVNWVEDAQKYLLGEPPYDDRIAYPLPNLVLTDLRLPGKSGLDLLQWIRRHSIFQTMPVVMLTGSALDQDIQTAYDSGADLCLVKPDRPEDLINIMLALSVYWIPPPVPKK